jgi:hypothetical protein
MPETFDIARFDRLSLLDEHLYDAYRRSQRTTEQEEQQTIAAQIRDMQRERTSLLEDLLSAFAR